MWSRTSPKARPPSSAQQFPSLGLAWAVQPIHTAINLEPVGFTFTFKYLPVQAQIPKYPNTKPPLYVAYLLNLSCNNNKCRIQETQNISKCGDNSTETQTNLSRFKQKKVICHLKTEKYDDCLLNLLTIYIGSTCSSWVIDLIQLIWAAYRMVWTTFLYTFDRVVIILQNKENTRWQQSVWNVIDWSDLFAVQWPSNGLGITAPSSLLSPLSGKNFF